jgi:hypothetical protein
MKEITELNTSTSNKSTKKCDSSNSDNLDNDFVKELLQSILSEVVIKNDAKEILTELNLNNQ